MRDDSPLYIFDGSFGDKEGSKPLRDYAVPEYFRRGSLQGSSAAKRRPPYRWVVIGPPRSGSRARRPAGDERVERADLGKETLGLFPPSAAH